MSKVVELSLPPDPLSLLERLAALLEKHDAGHFVSPVAAGLPHEGKTREAKLFQLSLYRAKKPG